WIHRRAASAESLDSRDSHQSESVLFGIRQTGVRPHRNPDQAGNGPTARTGYGHGQCLGLQLAKPVRGECSTSELRFGALRGKSRSEERRVGKEWRSRETREKSNKNL